MEWMLDIQLGRRNLSPIQRIAVIEKKREYYERKAKERQSETGGDRQAQCQSGTLLSLDEIAKELNMSKRNLQRALRIERNLTDSMKEFT